MVTPIRRVTERKHQKEQLELQLENLDLQLEGAEKAFEARVKELEVHDLRVAHAKAHETFLRTQFTNQELYHWMSQQLSGLYFQGYRLAFDMARKAEEAFNWELGHLVTKERYVQYGHWDSLRKGLLAGERLQLDLERMDAAYLAQNTRELEITKHVSLSLLDATSLTRLREEGLCFFHVPEALFDLDFPGHHFRRLKSVSLTLPGVSGAFAGVNAKLTLLGSSVRVSTDTTPGYARTSNLYVTESPDSRFLDDLTQESVVTSSAREDAGVFQFSLEGPRYLPFEGRGAISTWRLEFMGMSDLPQFDWSSLADAVLHLRYTAAEGAGLEAAVNSGLLADMYTGFGHTTTDSTTALAELTGATADQGLRMGFSAKHHFAEAWHQFLHPDSAASAQELELDLAKVIPAPFREVGITLTSVDLWMMLVDPSVYPAAEAGLPVTVHLGTTEVATGRVLCKDATGEVNFGQPHEPSVSLSGAGVDTLKISAALDDINDLPASLVEDGKLKVSMMSDFVVVLRFSLPT